MGAAYRARRDALLASGEDLAAELASFVDSPLWSQSITARILISKQRDAELHDRIRQAIAEADVARAQQTIAGIGGLFDDFAERTRVEWGSGALPLAWEVLLKEGDELPSITLLFHLAILRGLPDPRSVDVILAFMAGRDDQGMIEASARTLAAFPTPMTEIPVATAYRRHDLVAGALQRLRIDIHYSAKEGR
ncbi:MAG: hypothetical protein R3B70_24945 [Polyangiaceae bacterium]